MWTRAHLSLASVTVLVAATVVFLPVEPARAQAYTLGIDVSHWQEENGNTINWQKVADSGHVFAWHKATEGVTYSDPRYAGNRADAAAVGIPFGAYHFARPSGGTIAAAQSDAAAEAQHFLDVAQPASGDLIPVLDLEASGGIPAGRLIAWTQAWLDHVSEALDVKPLIYTGPNFWTTSMNDTTTFAAQGFPLWIAHYTTDPAPRVPGSNWNNSGWSFWQWTSKASVPGIVGNVDENRFAGPDLTPYKIPGAPLPEPTPDPATPPVNQSPPTISGETEVGQPLHASNGSWAGSQPQSYSYAWHRCGADGITCSGIEDGGTGATYTLRPADYGHRMKVTVTATNSAGSTPQDSAASDMVSDSVAPAPPRMLAPSGERTLALRMRVAWNSNETGVETFDVRSRTTSPSAGFGDYTAVLNDTPETQTTVDVTDGSTYCFSSRAVDEAGNRSEWSPERCSAVPLDDRSFESSGFERSSGTAFFAGTMSHAARRGAVLSVAEVRAKELYLVASKCPGCGKVAVSFNGRRLTTIDLEARATSHRRLIRVARFSSIRSGSIAIRVLSVRMPVKIDGLVLGI